jgi:hypothetical protein
MIILVLDLLIEVDILGAMKPTILIRTPSSEYTYASMRCFRFISNSLFKKRPLLLPLSLPIFEYLGLIIQITLRWGGGGEGTHDPSILYKLGRDSD